MQLSLVEEVILNIRVSVFSDGIEIDRFTNLEGDDQVTAVLCSENEKVWDNLSVSISSKESELSSFEMSLELKFLRYKLPYDGFDNTCDVQNFIVQGYSCNGKLILRYSYFRNSIYG